MAIDKYMTQQRTYGGERAYLLTLSTQQQIYDRYYAIILHAVPEPLAEANIYTLYSRS